MRKSVLAALLCGFAFATAAPALATAPADQPPLTVDKSVVRAGEQLELDLEHGEEVFGWISSPAFVRTGEHPVGADEGVARLVADRDGHAHATATIAEVPAGTYPVHTRVGGGAGPQLEITVVE
ncbi:hypothetical protein [Saccharopolyspora taberi]|uniref:Uncharacterized protein n=1 Tax=Saccharopolyspora taberi TaxID=60895 RepID=A0ABN3VKT2_9PSEU